MAYEVIKLDLDECGVALFTLNRPERHYALNRKMIAELDAVAFKLADDDSVRVVVLTGSGRSLCAGGDIGWFRDTLAQIGPARSRSVMLSGALFGAERVCALGLIDEVSDRLDAAIEAHVNADLETSLTAMAATKKLIALVDAHDIEAAKDHTSEALVDAWGTDDGLEGIASFLAKCLPSWRLVG